MNGHVSLRHCTHPPAYALPIAGSEVTPFAVVTDERTGQKYPLADCESCQGA